MTLSLPDRENILSRTHFAIVRDTTGSAGPLSYSKPCDAFQPAIGRYPATATGLGAVCLIDVLKKCLPEHTERPTWFVIDPCQHTVLHWPSWF